MPQESPEKVFLIDGTALFYRSFFALYNNPLINSKGVNTSAIYGFLLTLLKIRDEEKPDYLGVVFDAKGPTFRHEAYPQYKATREKMPDDLRDQFPKMRELLAALTIPVMELPGFEADDVLATLAVKAAGAGHSVFMVTADKDLMQVIEPQIKMYNLRRSGSDVDIIDREGVIAKMGVPPEKIVDYLALVGDTSDNVPGVPKVGPKTAVSLLDAYGSLAKILENVENISRKAVQASLRENTDLALLSQKLVTLKTDAPVKLDLDQLKYSEPDKTQFHTLFAELEFNSLLDRFQGGDTAPVQASCSYSIIEDKEGMDALLNKIREAGHCTLALLKSSQSPLLARIVGISLSYEPQQSCFMPVQKPAEEDTPFSALVLRGSSGFDLKPDLQSLLSDPAVIKNGHDIKNDALTLSSYGIELAGIESDTMLLAYLLNPTSRQHDLGALAIEHFGIERKGLGSLVGSGRKRIEVDEVALEKQALWCNEGADLSERLRLELAPELIRTGLDQLYNDVEIPLLKVLIKVEKFGVKLDNEFLENMSDELEKRLEALTSDIHAKATEPFNINSPKQLGKILFEKLKLPVIKRTKTGYSTDSGVLEKLAGKHDLPRAILEYRELSKLKSTYIDALPKLVNPFTQRLHTSYRQTIAATGRLSSTDPNLQNIPIRTELGRRIRKAFVPAESGWCILDADYSQIELRVMAHISGDETLLHAFRENFDIHQATAAQIFNIPTDEVEDEHRRKAKEINFGIMYGMGVFGLASRLRISREEAQTIIDAYFVKYPGVNQFIIDTLAAARKDGYVTTLLHRRRYLPEIKSGNRNIREFAERTAINMPIQGTAADLIKLATIKVMNSIEAAGLRSKMIMQVHDELVFEVPDDEVDLMKELVKTEMEQAMDLRVPLKAEVGTGGNWLEAH